jgi:hypothetical protein
MVKHTGTSKVIDEFSESENKFTWLRRTKIPMMKVKVFSVLPALRYRI